MEEPEESEEEQGSDDGAPAVLPAREDTVVHVFVSHVSTLCGWCCNASHIYVLNMFVRTQKVTSSRTSRSPGPKAKTTLQEYLVHPGKTHLVVEISEKMSANHRELIEDIASKLKSGKYTKEDALNMRAHSLKAGGCK